MLRISKILVASNEDYRMDHMAPDRSSGAPLFDVTLNGIYPKDFYGQKGLQYYADGQEGGMDAQSYSIICSNLNKPSARVQIFRSVPKGLNAQDLLDTHRKDMRYIQKKGLLPSVVSPKCPQSDLLQYGTTERQKASGYYNWLYLEAKRIEEQPLEDEKKITINPGDWVSINRAYAQQHGEHFAEGQKILTKTVYAKDLYTDGDSFHEWGYDPS
jgi:hypothetical protein